MKHVMIDLETLGTSPQAPILSIGAVFFDPETGETGRTLHDKLDFESACEGRAIDPATVKWWLTQSEDARQALLEDFGTSQISALELLTEFLSVGAVVWGNGAVFDISMLEDLYRQHEMRIPWTFWNVRDVRTIVDCAEGIISKEDFEFEGVKHDALADAIHQAKYVSAMWQALRGDKKGRSKDTDNGS